MTHTVDAPSIAPARPPHLTETFYRAISRLSGVAKVHCPDLIGKTHALHFCSHRMDISMVRRDVEEIGKELDALNRMYAELKRALEEPRT